MGRSVNIFSVLIRVDDLGLLGLSDVLGGSYRLALHLGYSVLGLFLVLGGLVLCCVCLSCVIVGILGLTLGNTLV